MPNNDPNIQLQRKQQPYQFNKSIAEVNNNELDRLNANRPGNIHGKNNNFINDF